MELIDDLTRYSDSLFSKRSMLMSLWQEIADHFYIERADFTEIRSLGTDMGSGLMTGFPLLIRRDLGNSFNAMLRPSGQAWAHITVAEIDRISREAKAWLEYATRVQRKAMYDRESNFVRAMKEGDHDFATFGQTVIGVEPDIETSTILYRCWHLRDCAWAEGRSQKVDTLFRKWKVPVRVVARLFGKDKLSTKSKELLDKDPYCEIDCMHAVLPSDQFGSKDQRAGKFKSVYWEVAPKHILEETGLRSFRYVVPRWQTVSGSQYAYSPATVCGLPDGRLLQAMTRVLLEAGEKAVDPPLIAVQEAIRSDFNTYAGGVTWVDAEYDERMGEVLRPMVQDRSGLPVGLQMIGNTQEMLREAFFLNKLSMIPQQRPEMTAYEASQYVQEYIRNALPLFEPMETEYNGGVCEETFDILMQFNTFGRPDAIPKDLRGEDVQFRFESPLQQAIDSQKGTLLARSRELINTVADIDSSSAAILDARVALRSALTGIGVPADWTRDDKDIEALSQQQSEDRNAEQELAAAQAASETAKNITQSQKNAAQAVI